MLPEGSEPALLSKCWAPEGEAGSKRRTLWNGWLFQWIQNNEYGLVGHTQQRGFWREKVGGTVIREAQWLASRRRATSQADTGSSQQEPARCGDLGPFRSQTGAPEGLSRRD